MAAAEGITATSKTKRPAVMEVEDREVSAIPGGLREGAHPAALGAEGLLAEPAEVAPLEVAPRVEVLRVVPAAQAVQSRRLEDLCLSARKGWSPHFGRPSRVS
jgi:hypothetical protein